MPNDTIERGIKKAAGNIDAVNYEEVTYEGYGPNGTAIIVKALTDNKNRTASMSETPSQRVAEVLEHRAVYPICLMKRDRSLSTRKSAIWRQMI